MSIWKLDLQRFSQEEGTQVLRVHWKKLLREVLNFSFLEAFISKLTACLELPELKSHPCAQ